MFSSAFQVLYVSVKISYYFFVALCTEAYKTHLFVLKLDLGPHDTVPDSFEKNFSVEYHMPNSTVSRAQIRSIGVNSEDPPDRWVHHLARYEYKVGFDFCDKPKAPLQGEGDLMPDSPQSPPAQASLDAEPAAEADEDDSDSSSSDSD